jgi:3-deoxy-manno-octulosonate cytidylyltransferase (CMP-KDO synthetase)
MASSEEPWIAVIPARYGSSRFPGKPLVLIKGVPMVVRVAQRVQRVPGLDGVIVATDDDRIQRACEEYGIGVRSTPSNCLTGTDRVWEAVRDLEGALILNVQGDEPLIMPEFVETVMAAKRRWPDAVINGQAPLSSIEDVLSRNVPKMLSTPDGVLLYASRAPVPTRHKSTDGLAELSAYQKQVCIYAFNHSELRRFAEARKRTRLESLEDIEILRFLELGIPVRVVDLPGGTLAVDVPEDVQRIEQALERSTR